MTNQIRVLGNLEGAHIETLDGKNLADVEQDYCLCDLANHKFPVKITPDNYDFIKNTLELCGGIWGLEQ
jgi:hypothetical protein